LALVISISCVYEWLAPPGPTAWYPKLSEPSAPAFAVYSTEAPSSVTVPFAGCASMR
jgi:hypothetical protein